MESNHKALNLQIGKLSLVRAINGLGLPPIVIVAGRGEKCKLFFQFFGYFELSICRF